MSNPFSGYMHPVLPLGYQAGDRYNNNSEKDTT